jgi:type IV secretory pathway TraG/TraD family ATPase VirD4
MDWCAFHPASAGAEAYLAFAVIALTLLLFDRVLNKPRSAEKRGKSVWQADHALLNLSKWDRFTLGDACEGVLVLGATGSGKSTGSGQALALSYLAAGFGGLVLTAKSDECNLWRSYCKAAGRLGDLYVFSPSQPLRFNFLDYELTRSGPGAGITDNIVHLFCEVLQVAERQSGQGGRDVEPYWARANRQLLRNLVDLLVMSKGTLSVPDLYRAVISAPTSLKQVGSEEWQKSSFCYRCLREADSRGKSPSQFRDFEIVADYFLAEYPGLSERTRSVVVSTFTSMIDVIHRGVLAELFCGTKTNITPEAIEDGAILVIDLPVKEFAEVGQFAQVLWKVAFQRSIERRNLAQNSRPVFLWADEAQYFTTAYDMQFQTTCRAARVATVYLTQSICNFYAALGGGEAGKAQADALLANLNTKIWHALGDYVTAEWASLLIGRSRQFLTNSSTSYQAGDWFSELTGIGAAAQTSAGVSEQIDFEVQPRRFTTLRKGGPANRWEVDGIIFQGGRRFRQTGKTWMPVTFRQR